jgi:hypothetical protein
MTELAFVRMKPLHHTQKPATHGCGRVLRETNHFDENTTTNWTSQASFDFLIHRRWTTAHRGMMAGFVVYSPQCNDPRRRYRQQAPISATSRQPAQPLGQ